MMLDGATYHRAIAHVEVAVTATVWVLICGLILCGPGRKGAFFPGRKAAARWSGTSARSSDRVFN
jgi:hypothetical protein